MPISIDEYRFPKFQRHQQQKPFSENKSAKFDAANLHQPLRRYRGESFPQPGYNPNSNQATVRQINIDRDDYTLPAY